MVEITHRKRSSHAFFAAGIVTARWEQDRVGGEPGMVFFAGASNQISLMKWAYDIKSIGSETTDILSYVS